MDTIWVYLIVIAIFGWGLFSIIRSIRKLAQGKCDCSQCEQSCASCPSQTKS